MTDIFPDGWKPRDYQMRGFNGYFEAHELYRIILMVGAIGGGKGDMIAWLMKFLAIDHGQRCLFLVHRGVLVTGVNSMEQRLLDTMGVDRRDIGYVLSGRKVTNAPIMLGMINTAVNRLNLEGIGDHTKIKYILIDEGHRVRPSVKNRKDGMYVKLLKRFPNAKISGWTATPERLSKKEWLGQIYEKAVLFVTKRELVTKRFSVPTRIIAPMVPNLKGVAVRGGEYVMKGKDGQRGLEDVYDNEALDQIADQIVKYSKGRRGITFTINSVMHCKMLAYKLYERGLKVDFITGETPERNPNKPSPHDRTGILERLKNGELDHVVNVNVLTEGVSVNIVSFVCLAFTTKSRAKFIQCNRGDRVVMNKDRTDWLKDENGEYIKSDCILLDCGNNAIGESHGAVEDYMLTVDIHTPPPTNKKKVKAPLKICGNPDCKLAVHPSVRICPDCGYKFKWGEDDHKYKANEVEWKELDSNLNFILKFRDNKMSTIIEYLRTKRKPELLIPIALVRNLELGWCVHKAVQLGYVKKNPDDIGEFNETLMYLERKTDQSGYRPLVNAIINQTVEI